MRISDERRESPKLTRNSSCLYQFQKSILHKSKTHYNEEGKESVKYRTSFTREEFETLDILLKKKRLKKINEEDNN